MKKRLISAAVALIILIPIIILGGKIFDVAVGIIALLAYKEIIDLKVSHNKIPFLVSILGAISLILIVFMSFDGYSINLGVSYKAIAILFLALLGSSVFYHEKGEYNTHDAIYLSGFILLLGIFFNSLILIRHIDLTHLLFILLIPMITDTFAFIFGKLIGKHTFTSISPNKTIEGCIAGSIIGTVVGTLFYINVIGSNMSFIRIGILILLLTIVGQIGDLLFSKIKRENNIKDFSNIMPGHGGILDRLDSIMLVTLAYVIIITLI